MRQLPNLTSVWVKSVGSVRHPPPIVSYLASMLLHSPQSEPLLGGTHEPGNRLATRLRLQRDSIRKSGLAFQSPPVLTETHAEGTSA